MCQKGAAGAKAAKRDTPWKEASLPVLHSLSFSLHLPNIHKVAAGWQGEEFASSYRDPWRNLQSWRPLQQPGGWEHGTKVLLADLGCPLHKPWVFQIVWLNTSKALKNKASISAVSHAICSASTSLETTEMTQVLSGWAGGQEYQSISFLLLKKQKGHLLLLLLTLSQHNVGRCCGRWIDEGCCSCDSERKKAQVCSAQMLATNWPGHKRQLFLEPNAKQDTEHPSPELYIKSENTVINGKSLPSNTIFFLCKDSPCDIKQWKP